MTSGIYMIRNKINDKRYIGSSCNIARRWREHENRLNVGTSKSKFLQNSWNAYGGKINFEFSIVEECNSDKLLEREQHHINLWKDSGLLLNISDCAGYALPPGAIMADDWREKISKSHNRRTPEQKEKSNLLRKETNAGKTPDQKKEIKLKQIASWENLTKERKNDRLSGIFSSGFNGTPELKEKAKRAMRESKNMNTPEQKAEILRKAKETKDRKTLEQKEKEKSVLVDAWKERTPEQKKRTIDATIECNRNRTPSQKENMQLKQRAWHKGLTIEQRAERSKKLSDVYRNRTQEERDSAILKRRETMKAKRLAKLQ